MLGIEMINEKISLLPDFPRDLALELKHLIISHHGQYEYGSPKRPKTLEALILSYLDDLDAKVADLQSFIQREQENHSKCAGYHQMLNRYIYKSLAAEGDTMNAETNLDAAYDSPADTSGEQE